MSHYGKRWTIDGLPTGLIMRSVPGNGKYTVVFEREFASLEQIEAVNWAKPTIEYIGPHASEPGLPEGYGFVVDDIQYQSDLKTYHVVLQTASQYLGDVTGYQDQIAELESAAAEKDGTTAELLWGYSDGGRFTSELPAHLMSHMARLKKDPQNRVIMHTHPTNTLAMTHVHELDDKKFTHTIWEMCTECIVVFPDGIGVLPWMVCGNNEIGEATAQKMEEYRLVVWGLHGIYGAGRDMDETFGLIETVEKAAQLYMLIAHLPHVNTIRDEELKAVAEAFGLEYRKDFLNL